MRFIRHRRFENLPSPVCTGAEHNDESLVREFDEVFDRLAAALGELYLVDTEGGCGIEGAPISMSRHVDICRQHMIVVQREAWHPDVIRILIEQLESLPPGWTIAIDVGGCPRGQAHIVVEADGTVHGWSDHGARAVLSAFGFDRLTGLFRKMDFAATSFIDELRRRRSIRKALSMPFRIEDHIQPNNESKRSESDPREWLASMSRTPCRNCAPRTFRAGTLGLAPANRHWR